MAGVRKKPLKSGKFQGWFIDFHGNRVFFTGSKNRKDTHRIAERLEDEHHQVKLGYRPAPTQADRYKKEPFAKIKKEYMAWGNAQGGRGGLPWSHSHKRNRQRHLSWWEETLNLKLMGDLEGCLSRAEKSLRSLQDKGRSGKTIGNYAEALGSFCNWCLQRDYLSNHPLKNLRALDTTPVTKRRALTKTEIMRILAVCEDHEHILLETALASGLRANELRNLTRNHLDMQQNGLILDKVWTKNRKSGFQPLPRQLMEKLDKFSIHEGAIKQYRKHFQRKDAKLIIPNHPLLFVPTHMSRMLDRLLGLAGILKETPEGKVDFHALRVAFVTLIIESGSTAIEAQTLARHATPQLTMNVYARARNERLSAIVENVSSTLFGEDKK